MFSSDSRARFALVALAVAAFCFVTTEVLPIGLLTVMAADLHRSESAAGLLVTGYAAVVLLASVPLVWLTQRVARRRLLVGTLAVFTAATALSSLAAGYGVLLGARLLTALAQALFWSVVASTATAMFPPAARGRVVARLAIGSALAPVLGVPAGVWLGQLAGWRVPFLVMAAAGAITGLALLAVLPPGVRADDPVGGGATPDARRYLLVLTVTVLAVTGVMGTFTYITPFLVEVSGFAPGALGALLLVSGVSGIAGTWSIGAILDRHPRHALLLPLATATVALAALATLGPVQGVAIAGLAALGLGFNALAPAIQARTLDVAPGSVDLASAGTSAIFNAGIAAGSFLGGVLLAGPGVRVIPVAALAAVTAALLVAVREPGPVRLPGPRRATADGQPARTWPPEGSAPMVEVMSAASCPPAGGRRP
ncbi:MFS transporter [Paractinoplanes rhizophilus]|uniref:MFS transporter n=1 Tax=Paractinoplanes rhizophilus TaxID=1416877 RepID=A0ABW2HVY0_9ACTN|nr:MFS transporter [Actinoplanes sp.]